MMEETVIVEAIMDVRAQIDFLWQFFVTVHIAIFALILIYGEAVEKLSWIGRAVSAAGIAAFEWINGKALVNTYNMAEAMHDQYRFAYGQVERFQPAFYEQFVLASFVDRPTMVMFTHSSALIVIVLGFATQSFLRHRDFRPLSW